MPLKLTDLVSLRAAECEGVKCEYGSICNRGQCTCPTCANINQPVCGTNQVTYQSLCHLRAEMCNERIRIAQAFEGPCDNNGEDLSFMKLCSSINNIFKRYKILLSRIRSPAKLLCHLYNLWLATCFFLLSSKVLSTRQFCLPAKVLCHMYNLWLLSCSILLSRNFFSNIFCWSGFMKLYPVPNSIELLDHKKYLSTKQFCLPE